MPSLHLHREGKLNAFSVDERLFANSMPTVALLLLFNLAALTPALVASRVYGVAFLVLVPGTVLLSLTPLQPRETSVRIALAVGASMLLLMLLGLFYSLLLPHVGINRPLSILPLLIGIDVLVLFGVAVQSSQREPLVYLLQNHAPRSREVAPVLLLGLLPLAAAAGAERLNNGHGGGLALVVLIAIGILLCGLVLLTERVPRWSIGVVLFSTSAAVLLMASMRSNYPFGIDIQSEYHVMTETLRAGAWHKPNASNAYAAYASMLSITVLPTVISATTHVSGTYLFKVFYPLVFSLFPVMVYVVAVRWFRPRAAVVGAVVLIVQGFYAADITGLARQEIALLYFALLVVVVFDERLSRRVRQVAAVAAGMAMGISHYSTAYFACTVLILGFLVQLPFRRSRRWRGRQALLTLPIIVLIIGVIVFWNAGVTQSAQNVSDLASGVESHGFQFLSGSPGSSFLDRFLNSDVTPSVSASKFAATIVPYYSAHFPWIHPYPVSLTKHYSVVSATIPQTHRNIPAAVGNLANNLTALLNELLLLMMAVGIVAILWRERTTLRGTRASLGFIAIGCLLLLGILRFSATVSTFYNAPRGQVQGAVLLSVGIAAVCSKMTSSHKRRTAAFTAVTAACLSLLFFTDSGLSNFVLGGAGTDTLVNYGQAYESDYFTTADVVSAQWVVRHKTDGQVIYADSYGAVQLNQISPLRAVVTTIIPQVIEPGAMVYATSSNVVDKTVLTTADNEFSAYTFPARFLNDVKNVVFSTGTTEVFR